MSLTAHEQAHLDLIHRYLAALSEGLVDDALSAFFCEDVMQEEFPNRLTPNGAQRDLAELRAAAERGAGLMKRQRFELLEAMVRDDTAALEVQWSGELARSVPGLPQQLCARLCVWIEFRDGKIARQRNYDCFDPW